MNEHHLDEDDDLARELRATRAEPREEFARELDARASRWLRAGERRRRLPSLRVAVPAVAAAAAATVAIALIADGDDPDGRLAVAVVPAQKGAAEGLSAAPQRDAEEDEHRAEETFLTSPRAVREGEPLVAEYSVPESVRAQVRLTDRETTVEVPAGQGRIEISTEGIEPGTYDLEIDLPPIPTQRTLVEVTPGG